MVRSWVGAYTEELKQVLDGGMADVCICGYCDELWIYCRHGGDSYHLRGSEAVEYLLRKLGAYDC